MALGKKIIEVNFSQFSEGMSTSEQLADAGFSPDTDGVQLVALPGVLYNPPVPVDHSTGLSGEFIASSEDPTGHYARLYVASDLGDGNFYSMGNAFTLTQQGSTDTTHEYDEGKTDMIGFDGEAYITSNSSIVRWSAIGTSNTFNTSFFSFINAFVPHPALVFNNFAYYGDGNVLYRQASAGATPSAILTLSAGVVIVALAIDPGSGNMLLSLIGQQNLSDTLNSGARVAFYDGFSTQVLRYVPVEDMVTAFWATEGSLYAGYGQNLGLWNGSGITFLRHMDINFDNTELLYKQHFTSIGSTLYVIERARIIAYGPTRQKGPPVFYPALTNLVSGTETDLSLIVNLGSNKMGLSYADSQFSVFDSFAIEPNKQSFYSNNYNFDDEVWLRRARVIYHDKVANNNTPGDLVIYGEEGLVTDVNATGTYSLMNTKGFASGYKDVDNLNLRLKQMTFGLLLNDFDAPALAGTVTTAQSHSPTNSVSYTHTVPSDLTNSLLLVMVTGINSTTITGTANGVAMAKHDFTTVNFSSTLLFVQNPTPGVNAIEVDFLISTHDIGITTFVLQNAGAPTAFASNAGTATSASVSLTSTLSKSLFVDFIEAQPATQTQGAGQTEQSNFTIATSGLVASSSTKAVNAAGATTMTVGFSDDVSYQINGFVVPPTQQAINPGIERVIFYADPANITGSAN